MKNMSKIERQLIIGNGEVGGALQNILKADALDLTFSDVNFGQYDVLHICFPYKDRGFIGYVRDYQKRFRPKLTIIHSSVPIGTSRKCGSVHSPIRGVHPHLAKGIKTFVKYFGGPQAGIAAGLFKSFGIKTRSYKLAETTEAIKLWDTTQYGWQIMLEKEIYNWCRENNLDFKEIYQTANRDYNEGYLALGRPEVVRPYLNHKDGPIGGHCVIPNAHLLKSPVTRGLLKFNKSLLKG